MKQRKPNRKKRRATRDAIQYEMAKREWAKQDKTQEFNRLQAAVDVHGWKKVYRDKFLKQKMSANVHNHLRAVLRHMERLAKLLEVKA
jgi:hypothetical protein